MFKKIIFFIFIFSFLHILIFTKNVEAAFIADPSLVAGCTSTTTTANLYVIDTTNLIGTLPLCLQDADVGQTLTIYNIFGTSLYSTTSIGSNNNQGKIFYDYSVTIPTPNIWPTSTQYNFLISDPYFTGTRPSVFNLTLRPAFRVKFLNPNPTDNDLTDTFATVTVGSTEKRVKTIENIFPIIISEATSTATALGGTIATPTSISINKSLAKLKQPKKYLSW